jgi:DNA repair exonuclease SbcCD ATPase subunit
MKTTILGFALLLSPLCNAQIEPYKSTDNTGINKLERIGVIETYLSNLSSALKNMESKIEANTLKLTSLENSLKNKDEDIKKIQGQLGEKKPVGPEMAELEKLKADMLAIKNEDIEKIRIQVQGLNYSVQSMQGLMEIRK